MALKAEDFWQIVDVFESIDGTMFTVWDHVACKRRTLHTEAATHGFEAGDLVKYELHGGKIKIKPVEPDFIVPKDAKLLLPVKEHHQHAGIPAGGLIMSSNDLGRRRIQHV